MHLVVVQVELTSSVAGLALSWPGVAELTLLLVFAEISSDSSTLIAIILSKNLKLLSVLPVLQT
jgi:hypothetical protein